MCINVRSENNTNSVSGFSSKYNNHHKIDYCFWYGKKKYARLRIPKSDKFVTLEITVTPSPADVSNNNFSKSLLMLAGNYNRFCLKNLGDAISINGYIIDNYIDIYIGEPSGYGKVTIDLSTHNLGGIPDSLEVLLKNNLIETSIENSLPTTYTSKITFTEG